MDILQQYKQYIQAHHLFQPSDHLIVAVSGGVDSVVLCDLCYHAGYHFTIAHCNFNLRGAESNRDEAFVKSLGTKYGVEVLVKGFDTKEYAATQKLSIQEGARKLRYDWFYEIINERQSPENKIAIIDKEQPSVEKDKAGFAGNSPAASSRCFILTAHHQDDNIETVLMNFFKGTGISGLRAILPKQGKIIRPLLGFSKNQLSDYAVQKNLTWVQDSSNNETKYTRNFFRHTVIPLIEKVYPAAATNVAANIKRFSDVELLYQQAIEVHKKKLLEQRGSEVHIPVLKLLQAIPLPTLVYEITREYGFSSHQTDEVIKLLHSESGRYCLSATHRILRNRKWLIITPLLPQQSEMIVIEKEAELIFYDDCRLEMSELAEENFSIPHTKLIAAVDQKEVRFPLLLRKWKEGDYFYPLGMKKKKKLARFFIDQKLSKIEKEKVWVLESHKKIVWVIGYRIDDRFKITGSTKTVLQLTASSL